MDLHLAGKRVLVTGSGSGIGKATAKAFLQEGAEVIVHGLTKAEVESCLDELKPLGQAQGKTADLAHANDAEALCDFALNGGEIDILVNNVGVFSVKPFDEISDEDWLGFFNINVLSAVRMSRRILPRMLQRGTGAIVNLASEAGVKPLPQMIHYSVTKTAMLGLTRGMAELTKGTEVRINSILPGPTWTEGVQAYFDGLAKEKGQPLKEIVENYFQIDEPTSLIQRFVEPEEVARTILTVASNKAANGAGYRVEGGIVRSIL